jgi:hypothetical protein
MPARRFIKNDPEELAAYIKSRARGLVVFDGRPTAGKSYLLRTMGKRLPYPSVDADDFLTTGLRKYIEGLKLDALRDHIESSLASSALVLLGGVCARQIVERAKFTAAAYVWVEKSSVACLEIDERDFSADHHRDMRYAGWLYAEVEAYIAAFNPRSRPDVVYLNAPG